MQADVLTKHFARMGARLQVRAPRAARAVPGQREPLVDTALHLNVRRDSRGEMFTMTLHPEVEATVVDVQPAQRHLLLHTMSPDGNAARFLCGHDEREWFVAAIPEAARGVVDVRTAQLALQPSELADAVSRLRRRDQVKRRNAAFKRQGEWFFVPVPDLKPEPWFVLNHEPLSRGAGSKPHVMEFVYRRGGQLVYVNSQHPTGRTQTQFEQLSEKERKRLWRPMQRDAEVFAKGCIRHADHRTLVLSCWHRVLMNTEHKAQAMRQVVFLD